MATIAFPTNTRDIINDIRNAIGRNVEFVTVATSGCYNCSLDPVTLGSTNPYCPVCSGIYYIPTYTVNNINAHVTWGNSDNLMWQTGGQLLDGDCRVQIEHTAANKAILNTLAYVVVDERKLFLNKKIFRGVPALNRILLDLEEEKENE